MKSQFNFETSLEGYGPEALEAFEVVLAKAERLDASPSDVLIDEFEDRVDLAAHCFEIFDLVINEMAVRRLFPDVSSGCAQSKDQRSKF